MKITKLLGIRRFLTLSASRNYASLTSPKGNETSKGSFISQELHVEYQKALPKIFDKVLKENHVLADVEQRIRRITSYNVGGGKNLRCWLITLAYELLEKPEKISQKSMDQIYAMAWGVEMTNACFLMADDIEDGSETRRGKPCWHKVPDVGNLVVNDTSLLQSLVYEILQQYVKDEPSYTDIVDIFDESFLETFVGQHMDVALPKERNGLINYTMENFYIIADYKTSYYTFKFPLYLAITLANQADGKSLRCLEELCNDVGRFYQIQNDYYDTYGSSVTGKIGTDIEEGKCSWLVVTALQRCNPAQRAELTQSYGSWDPANVERVKQLYEELKVPQSYKTFEQDFYVNMPRKAQTLCEGTNVKPEIFSRIVDMLKNIYIKI